MSIVEEALTSESPLLMRSFGRLFSLLKKLGSTVVDPSFGSIERVSSGFCLGLELLPKLKVFTETDVCC